MTGCHSDDFRLVYNDDTDIVGTTEVPITREGVQSVIDAHIGTQVDTFVARTGCNGAYVFDTRVESRFGDGIEVFDRATFWRRKENLRILLEAGLDPLRIQIERGLADSDAKSVGAFLFPEALGGHLGLAHTIVAESIDRLKAAGLKVGGAETILAGAEGFMARGDWFRAYRELGRAYRTAVR